jgi:protein-S-isoprenylcysteine O-methyltransferase Ste14
MAPIHFLSVEHLKFHKKYGTERGTKITNILGMISGWGFFIFLFGIWISPQPKFIIPFLQTPVIIHLINFSIPLLHLLLAVPLIIIGAWFGIVGVKATSLKVAETHHTDKIITTGIYAHIRHPQYFGAILSHIGVSFLISSLYSLLVSPLIILYSYLTARKEEQELIHEFGPEYLNYQKQVPMLYPKV